MKQLQGKVAVITGAGSGIGRALALNLAKAGCRLAIADINLANVKQTAEMTGLNARDIWAAKLDVADRQAFYNYADKVVKKFDAAHLVINNAGVAVAATVADLTYDDFEWLMNINFWGVVYGTKAFLPHLKAAGEGHIVNVSSVFGIIGVPTQSAYNAAKFAVRGFTEALRIELDVENCGVSCSCVHPGGIKTNIARAARKGEMGKFASDGDMGDNFEKMAKTTPDEAARVIVDGVKKNKRRILIGADAYAIDAMQRSMPTAYQALIARASQMGKK